MSKKKKDHTGIRNGKMFCFHCGGEYDMNLPQPIDMVSAMSKVFTKQHKDCEPTWKQPVPDPSWPVYRRVAFWCANGECGLSSDVIFAAMSGLHVHKVDHPCDPDDFRRCHMLLEMVPEWRSELHRMREVSSVWSNLVDNWDDLTILLKEQLAGKKNNMYEVMKSLGC